MKWDEPGNKKYDWRYYWEKLLKTQKYNSNDKFETNLSALFIPEVNTELLGTYCYKKKENEISDEKQ